MLKLVSSTSSKASVFVFGFPFFPDSPGETVLAVVPKTLGQRQVGPIQGPGTGGWRCFDKITFSGEEQIFFKLKLGKDLSPLARFGFDSKGDGCWYIENNSFKITVFEAIQEGSFKARAHIGLDFATDHPIQRTDEVVVDTESDARISTDIT